MQFLNSDSSLFYKIFEIILRVGGLIMYIVSLLYYFNLFIKVLSFFTK